MTFFGSGLEPIQINNAPINVTFLYKRNELISFPLNKGFAGIKICKSKPKIVKIINL